MVEAVEARTILWCREAIGQVSLDDLRELLLGFMEASSLSIRGSEIRVTYIARPDEFTKKRIKVRLSFEKGEGQLRVKGKGDIDLELMAKCVNEEATVALSVTGKAERFISQSQVERLVTRLLDLLEVKSSEIAERMGVRVEALQPPQPVEAPTAAEARPPTPPQPPAPTPTAVPAEQVVRDCAARLLTAGLPVDEELSKRIKTEYHVRASTLGALVEDGRANTEELDLSRYTEGFDVRIAHGDILVETVRLNGKVGIYYRNYRTGEEAYGSEALEKASRELCEKNIRVTYLVIRLPS